MTTKPTGRKRYRKHFRLFRVSLMVLQIECREIGRIRVMQDNFIEINRTFWRDATVEDLTVEVPK